MALTREEGIGRTKEFLRKNILCVISTVSSENKPEAAVSIYMAGDNFNFYFITRE